MLNLYVVCHVGSFLHHAVHMLSLCEYHDLCGIMFCFWSIRWFFPFKVSLSFQTLWHIRSLYDAAPQWLTTLQHYQRILTEDKYLSATYFHFVPKNPATKPKGTKRLFHNLFPKQRSYYSVNADSTTDGAAAGIFAYHLMPWRDWNPRRVAPGWGLWRTLYWLSYSAAVNNKYDIHSWIWIKIKVDKGCVPA